MSNPDTELLRKIIREELDRKSFATASQWLTHDETMAYLKMSRSTLWERRKARKLAKTDEAKALAFAPEHGRGMLLRFHRSDLDAWMAMQ